MGAFVQIFMFSLFLLLSLSNAQSSPKPKALLLPISKDPTTLQYITHFSLGTPLVPRNFVLDLGGETLWMDCQAGYKSSTYRPGRCGTAPCSLAKANGCFNCNHPPRPGCTNNTCSLSADNTIRREVDYEELAMDTISLASTDGSKPGPLVTIPNFIFGCAQTSHLKGLSSSAHGMAGLGRTSIGLTTHIPAAFGGTMRRKFALCLPSSSSSKHNNGVLFMGESPYKFYPDYNRSALVDFKNLFSYTRLYINPMSTANSYIRGEPSADYFVQLTSIVINGNSLPLNTTLLTINNKGIGGTKISTINPYTVLQSSIYQALSTEFSSLLESVNVTKVAAVAPFPDCYNRELFSHLHPSNPVVTLMFEKGASWKLWEYNTVVEMSPEVMCLAFVDGGLRPRTSIVVGAYQLEDNLVEFDLAASRVGFTSSIIWDATRCTSFNF